MSLEITAVLICDGCKARITSEVEYRSTRAASPAWEVKNIAELQGWIQVNRGRFHTPTHYCKECSDKPMKPVPRKRTNRR